MGTDYQQYCPISKAMEVLGERWTLLVVREFLVGSRKFNDIARGVPGRSRTMLTKRLLRDPTVDECDALLLMWWAHSRLDTSQLPADRRTVMKFHFTDVAERFWVVIEPRGTSICLTDPGFDTDATISTEAPVLHKVWYGRQTIWRSSHKACGSRARRPSPAGSPDSSARSRHRAVGPRRRTRLPTNLSTERSHLKRRRHATTSTRDLGRSRTVVRCRRGDDNP